MAFNFGSTATKPLFGTPTTTSSFSFGATPAVTTSLFGSPAPAAATPSTGLFGTPTATATQSAGLFGTPAAAAPSTGLFGSPAVAAPATGLFGSAAAPTSLFGSTTKPSTGLFGSTTTTTASAGLFGSTATPSTGLFGSATSTPSTGMFGAKTTLAFSFGTPTASVASTGLFGTPAKTTPSLFGTPTAAAKPGLFGSTTSSLFGTTPQAGGLFGAAKPTTSLFGVPGAPVATLQTAEQIYAEGEKNLLKALTTPTLFGDERDVVIAKWNQLQAGYGSGKAYYTQQGAFVELTQENTYCKFKAIGYNCVSKSRNKDGVVMFIFKKPLSEVKANQAQLIDGLQKLFGSKPNLTVRVDGIREVPNNTTELLLFVEEQSALGEKTRVSAQVFNQFLNTVKQQLVTQMAVHEFYPKVGLTKEQIKNYLNNAPRGINPLIWKQSIHDNPDPELIIPVPMVGFDYLSVRMQHQQGQAKAHAARMEIIKDDISEMKFDQLEIIGKIEQYKVRLMSLSHRILQVIVVQEIERKLGFAADEFDERMRNQLEALQSQLNCPTEYKARLNEILSQIRMQDSYGTANNYQKSQTLELNQEQKAVITNQLSRDQDGIQILIGMMNQSMMDMKVIESVYMKNKNKYNYL